MYLEPYHMSMIESFNENSYNGWKPTWNGFIFESVALHFAKNSCRKKSKKIAEFFTCRAWQNYVSLYSTGSSI